MKDDYSLPVYLVLNLYKLNQVVEKDPGAAILWFWKAINAKDRVDSALKDMAVVMKQQDRAEEAIEAIRSFRHLCSKQAQESLDNLLIDLYKVHIMQLRTQVKGIINKQINFNYGANYVTCDIELSEMWKDRGTNTASKAEAAYDISWGGFPWEDHENSAFTWKEVPNLH